MGNAANKGLLMGFLHGNVGAGVKRAGGTSGRKNVMSMRELFCPDPLAGFEKMAGFQIFYCLKIKCFQFVSKIVSCGYNLVVSKFSRRIPPSKTDFNDIAFLALYWKCACVGPIFFEMHSQNVLI